MDQHYIDDYPLLVARLRECMPTWTWTEPMGDVEDRIEIILGRTSWGMLREFEVALRELRDSTTKLSVVKMFEDILAPSTPIKTDPGDLRRCFVDSSMGCINGETVHLMNVPEEHRTEATHTGITCAAWIDDTCRCLRWAPRRKVSRESPLLNDEFQ